MKKNGFTLAEVLITLGIIGVIAAITLPTLMTDTTAAQIGPKLAKAVSSFEQANESMLNAYSVDSLTDAGIITSTTSVNQYQNILMKHLKGTIDGTGAFLTKDGMQLKFTITSASPANPVDPAHMQRIGNVQIDINGSSKPNVSGSDIFYFSWWNDGSLRPKGARNWEGTSGTTWESKCPKAENGAISGDGYDYCAGHVFENNLKVLYR